MSATDPPQTPDTAPNPQDATRADAAAAPRGVANTQTTTTPSDCNLDSPCREILDKYAETYRQMINHENKLRDERVKWLLTAQPFLFAAYGLSVSENLPFARVVACMGIVVSVGLWLDLFLGNCAIHNLDDEWKTLRRRYDEYCGPEVIGYRGSRWLYFGGASFILPVALAVGWIVMVCRS